jgi:SAM-dependent methyltransferase
MSNRQRIQEKYAPLVGIDQFGDGSRTDELQYWNYGIWDENQTDPKLASETLVEMLIGLLPSAPARILDVGFGQGASVRELCRRYGSSNVVGVNIAADQVERARASGVDCDLRVMDAVDLDFEPGSFDAILCVEAAFHFDSREKFLKRAFTALKSGGRLVLSDFLMRGGVGLDPAIFPPANIVGSLDDYQNAFGNAGFREEKLEIEITTNRQLVPFIARMAEFAGYLPEPDPEVIRIDQRHSQVSISFILTRLLNIGETVVVVAVKE